jgi:outer membrane protein assembly factor BamA
MSTTTTEDALLTKLAKAFENQRIKIDKLNADNQKLKETIAQMKYANSRVKRIPKTTTTAAEVPGTA